MRSLLSLTTLLAAACATLPPTHDPEGCDRVSEAEKRTGSDLVVDGILTCTSADGDCNLRAAKVIASRKIGPPGGDDITVHILRHEAARYSDELHTKDQIAFCYPAELWYPSEGRYRGRFYLKQDAQGRFVTAFYPRAKEI